MPEPSSKIRKIAFHGEIQEGLLSADLESQTREGISRLIKLFCEEKASRNVILIHLDDGPAIKFENGPDQEVLVSFLPPTAVYEK